MKTISKLLVFLFFLLIPVQGYANSVDNEPVMQRRYQIEKQKLTIISYRKPENPMDPIIKVIYEFDITYVIFKADGVKAVKWEGGTKGSYQRGEKKVPIDWEIDYAFAQSLAPNEVEFHFIVQNQ